MGKRTLLVATLLFLAFSFTLAIAEQHTPYEKGKAHFNNPTFAGGNKSCNTCHPDGKGLKDAGAKEKFRIMGGVQNSLEAVVNVCIINANKGKAIDVNSAEMQELVSYIKSLGE